MGATQLNRACASFLLGAMAWLVGSELGGQAGSREAFAWVADRDAGLVVALDRDLREVEVWFVPRPTALVAAEDEVLVRGRWWASEERWWRLRRGSLPEYCDPPQRGCVVDDTDCGLERARSTPGLQGVPTAWARSGDSVLIATPGAVHLISEGGDLRLVQGGFEWISALVLVGQTSRAGAGGAGFLDRAALAEPGGP